MQHRERRIAGPEIVEVKLNTQFRYIVQRLPNFTVCLKIIEDSVISRAMLWGLILQKLSIADSCSAKVACIWILEIFILSSIHYQNSRCHIDNCLSAELSTHIFLAVRFDLFLPLMMNSSGPMLPSSLSDHRSSASKPFHLVIVDIHDRLIMQIKIVVFKAWVNRWRISTFRWRICAKLKRKFGNDFDHSLWQCIAIPACLRNDSWSTALSGSVPYQCCNPQTRCQSSNMETAV